jgi:hypothetical protein
MAEALNQPTTEESRTTGDENTLIAHFIPNVASLFQYRIKIFDKQRM